MKRLTKEQAIVISAYTGVLICDFGDMHEDVERRMKRPVWTHEFANEEMRKRLRQLYREDFLSMVPLEGEA